MMSSNNSKTFAQQEYDTRWDAIFGRDIAEPNKSIEDYRVNKLGQCERFREGAWELDSSKS